MENSKLLTIQEMLMREMKRLDDDKTMKNNGKEEIARSNALSQSACTYLKSVNVNLRIMEQCSKNEVTMSSVNKQLGLTEK